MKTACGSGNLPPSKRKAKKESLKIEDEMDLEMLSKKRRLDKILLKMSKKKWEGEVVEKGQKKALLIGLKHPQMKTASDDVKGKILSVKEQLIKWRGFTEDDITLLIQDDDEFTGMDIRIQLCKLIEFSQPGAILFLHLIAHGCSEGVITTPDHGRIPDSYFRTLISSAVRYGLTLTFVSDCLIEPAPAQSCCPRSMSSDIKGGVSQKKLIRDLFAKKTQAFPCDFKSLSPTHNLSCVDILNFKEEQDLVNKSSSSLANPDSRVVLLTAFQPPTSPFEFFFPPPPKPKPRTSSSYGGFTNAIIDVIEETQGLVTNLELAQKAMDKLGGEIPGLFSNLHRHACASFLS